MYRLILSLLVSLPMLVPGVYAGNMQNALNGKEIKQLVSGNTVEGHFTKPREEKEYLTTEVKFSSYFAPNGEIVERSAAAAAGGGAGHVAAHGSWFVKKGKLCVKFRDAKDNKKKCRKVIPRGSNSYELYTGKGKLYRTWDRVVHGNPLGLK